MRTRTLDMDIEGPANFPRFVFGLEVKTPSAALATQAEKASVVLEMAPFMTPALLISISVPSVSTLVRFCCVHKWFIRQGWSPDTSRPFGHISLWHKLIA